MAIQILPSDVVDQIAAGEVVERPAHLIKELVENALDAHATQIEVEFNSGGREVRVSDDGCGMVPEDLPRALARHATSKIHRFDDLFQLNTFGFRGEALASIGAVSRLTLISRQSSSECAHRLKSEFGRAQELETVGGTFGTTVIVDELFANVPARLKFLKAEGSETSQIRTVLKALALSHPHIEMRVKSRGQLLNLWSPRASPKERVEQVLDSHPLYEAHGELEGLKVHIVFSSPNHTARNSRQSWLFAQNRWVQDKTMQAAVMESYRSLLMHGEYPIVAVFLTANPADVDVNIHPAKSAVKFRESSQVYRLIQRTLRSALETAPWLKDILPARAETPQPGRDGRPSPSGERAGPLQANYQATHFHDPELTRTQYQKREFPFSQLMSQMRDYATRETSSMSSQPTTSLEPAVRGWAQLQVLGQAHLTYIITQSESGLMFVDQHAAHERIGFERLMTAWREGRIEQQQFLLPLALDIDEEQMDHVMAHKLELAKLAVTIEQGGPHTLYVSSAPVIVSDDAVVKALHTFAHEVSDKGGSFALEKAVQHLCATMACHSAVRAGQALSIEQMRELLVQMDEFPLSSFCPHGRPVFVEYPLSRLEREFGRTV